MIKMNDATRFCRIANRKAAFTLLELLIALAVIGVLLALALTSLRGARENTREVLCRSRVASIGSMVAQYAADFRGAYPVWVAPPQASEVSVSLLTAYSQQSFRLFITDRWLAYSGLDARSPTLRCPSNQRVRNEGVSPADFVGVSAMHAEPSYLDPALPPAEWKARNGAAPQRLDSVAFPSRKVGVFEIDVWHGWSGTYGEGRTISGLEVFSSTSRSSCWFFDGHADGLSYPDALACVDRKPIWWSGKIVLTAHGSRGVDR